MSRPPIPTELKKKHRREYMRNYRKQKLQQSFSTAIAVWMDGHAAAQMEALCAAKSD